MKNIFQSLTVTIKSMIKFFREGGLFGGVKKFIAKYRFFRTFSLKRKFLENISFLGR
jgi:hypothetical protein